jgi:hypothetical protein
MSRNCRVSIMIVAVAVAACGGGHTSRTTPVDPFAGIAVGQLPVGTLSGSNVLVLVTGGVVLGDTSGALPQLETERTAILTIANEAIDTALRRDARDVNWMGLEEQRHAAHRNPTLGIDPDRLPTAYTAAATVERIPDPLWSQVRMLSALTGARYAVIPAAVRVTGRDSAYVGEYVVVGADTRTGGIVFRSRAIGRPSPTLRAAFASAAATRVATPLSQPPRP